MVEPKKLLQAFAIFFKDISKWKVQIRYDKIIES